MSRPSTASPSPTSTVFHPDVEQGPTNDAGPSRSRTPAGEKTRREAVSADGGNRSRSADADQPLSQEKQEKEDWVVKWDGPDDPGCPLNTPPWRKW